MIKEIDRDMVEIFIALVRGLLTSCKVFYVPPGIAGVCAPVRHRRKDYLPGATGQPGC